MQPSPLSDFGNSHYPQNKLVSRGVASSTQQEGGWASDTFTFPLSKSRLLGRPWQRYMSHKVGREGEGAPHSEGLLSSQTSAALHCSGLGVLDFHKRSRRTLTFVLETSLSRVLSASTVSVSDEARAEVNGLKASRYFSLAERLNVSAAPFIWLFIRPPWSVSGSCCKAVVHESLRAERQLQRVSPGQGRV